MLPLYPSSLDRKKVIYRDLETYQHNVRGSKFKTYSHSISYGESSLITCPGRMRLNEGITSHPDSKYKHQATLYTTSDVECGKEILCFSKLLRETCIAHVEAEGKKGNFIPRYNKKQRGTKEIHSMLKSIILPQNTVRGLVNEEELSTLKIVVALDSDTKFIKVNGSPIPWETAQKMKNIELIPTIRVEEVHYHVFHAAFYLRMTLATILDSDDKHEKVCFSSEEKEGQKEEETTEKREGVEKEK